MIKDKKWLKEEIQKKIDQPTIFYSPVVSERKIVYREIINLIDQLEEPKKPVVPQVVAEWIEGVRNHYSLGAIFHDAYRGCIGKNNIEDYIIKNQDTFARAWLDGYEVEKEPRWVVKRKNGDYVDYFGESVMHMKIETFIDLTSDLDSSAPHKFTDKAKAEAVALLVDGVVEEVGK